MADDDRLDKLSEQLKKIRQEEENESAAARQKDEDSRNMNVGIRAGTELVVSIGAGTLIGYLLDQWLGTKPLFLIIFLLAGIGAGFTNIYRITNNMGSSVGFAPLHNEKKGAKKASPEDNEK